MRVYNPQSDKTLHKELVEVLRVIRTKRKFNPGKYLNKKSALLNNYMNKYHLKSCIVAVSGGIDSAVVLGISHQASRQKDSPIKKIYAILMPIFSKTATTNQKDALKRGQRVSKFFGASIAVVDLTESHKEIKRKVDTAIALDGKPWASGQLAAYIKTPALYYTTSLLSENSLPGIVCGTTNRDEGAYLGYFGKASDGMVDIQIISDIHKSEVFKLAEQLNIPRSIINVKPSGDMYDGRIDEDVFGTTYDFVELYVSYLSFSKSQREKLLKSLNKKSKQQFGKLSKRLEKMHTYNLHKYLGKSPSIHLDVYQRAVPGGWDES